MISRNLSRRLERLEARLMPASDPPVIVLQVRSVATGDTIQRIVMPCYDDPHYRGRRTRRWQHKAYEVNRQTTSSA
jgi:hypothetical protein